MKCSFKGCRNKGIYVLPLTQFEPEPMYYCEKHKDLSVVKTEIKILEVLE
jgi:hypothetical protein